MINLSKIEIEILKVLYDRYNEDPSFSITSGENLLLTEKLHISRKEANAAIGFLKNKGLIKLTEYYNQDYYQDFCQITANGIDALRELELPSQQNTGSPSIVNNGVMFNPIIGNDNSVSITIDKLTIENSVNFLRELASSDNAKKIVSEMKQEANSRRPSLDKLRDLGKDFLAEAGDVAKQTIVNLISAVLIQNLGM